MNELLKLNRRTALKMTGAGLVGSALFSGSAAAQDRWEASVMFMNTGFVGPGDEPGNITADDDGNELVLHGAAVFNGNEGSDAEGGGPFSLESDEDADGTWTAEEVVRFKTYGSFLTGESMLPQSWKGGLVELEVEFDPNPTGVGDDDTLIIECGVGTHDSDELELGSGFYLGPYDDVKAAANVFTYG